MDSRMYRSEMVMAAKGRGPNGQTVSVQTFDVTDGRRQIAPTVRGQDLLRDRRSDILAAITEATEVLQAAADHVRTESGWRVSSIQATFGVVLTAEAGVILSKASAEASLEVAITVEHA